MFISLPMFEVGDVVDVVDIHYYNIIRTKILGYKGENIFLIDTGDFVPRSRILYIYKKYGIVLFNPYYGEELKE